MLSFYISETEISDFLYDVILEPYDSDCGIDFDSDDEDADSSYAPPRHIRRASHPPSPVTSSDEENILNFRSAAGPSNDPNAKVQNVRCPEPFT